VWVGVISKSRKNRRGVKEAMLRGLLVAYGGHCIERT
jgi:hypothetical protein